MNPILGIVESAYSPSRRVFGFIHDAFKTDTYYYASRKIVRGVSFSGSSTTRQELYQVCARWPL